MKEKIIMILVVIFFLMILHFINSQENFAVRVFLKALLKFFLEILQGIANVIRFIT